MRPIRFFARAISIILLAAIWTSSAVAPVAQAQTVAPTPSVAVPVPSRTVKVAAPKPAITYLPAGLAASTPLIAQGDFLDGYACAPTSVAMVMGYFHATAGLATATPQQLVEPGDYLPGQGVPYNNMINSMLALGYNHPSGHENATISELSADMASGPVIVVLGVTNAGTTLVPGPVSHSVVVVGIASDGNSVLVNDPWTARQLKLSMTDFTAMWAGGNHGIVLIRP